MVYTSRALARKRFLHDNLHTVLHQSFWQRFPQKLPTLTTLPSVTKIVTYVDPSPEFSVASVVQIQHDKQQHMVIVKALSQNADDAKTREALLRTYFTALQKEYPRAPRHLVVVEVNFGGKPLGEHVLSLCQKVFPGIKGKLECQTHATSVAGIEQLCTLVKDQHLVCLPDATSLAESMALLRQVETQKGSSRYAAHAFDSLLETVVYALYWFDAIDNIISFHKNLFEFLFDKL